MSTPWTRKSSSSSSTLSSDRIKPRNTQSQNKTFGKQKQKQSETVPKSKELLILESFLRAVQTTPIPDPKGGCFCQAREHTLSPYTPACSTCGLVLCSLNAPQHACPHCHEAPPPHHRESLIVRLQGEIAALIQREEQQREWAREAAGAFPSLGGGSGSGRVTPVPAPIQHKVLSVNSKTKKVTVSTPVPSRPESPEEEDDELLRVPPPPEGVVYAKRAVDPARPFANYAGEAARYVSKENEAVL
ncbi:hypothetical protein DFS33DRAFT_1262235 [Desarmillaria ectypa]|nr:hypothetical protein DFS33DRAFT_1262235 [Desarmillaria ectypa]